MKPVNLKICGFGAFGEQVEIPFDKLGNGGLFLVAGKTGAGKTTIFDAISYALFGEVSGSNRSVDGLRSDFSKPETPTFVELIFTHKNSTYTVKRNPKYKRPKLRTDGFTEEKSDATVFKNGENVADGIGAVNEYIKGILGINASQFKQISMLPQGEFLKLLFAPSSEKIEIFRTIFNTNIFEKFQKHLKEVTLKSMNDLEKININLEQHLKILAPNDNEKTMRYNAEEIIDRKQLWCEEEKNKLEKLTENKEVLTKKIGELIGKISASEIENQNILQREKNEKELEKLLEDFQNQEYEKSVLTKKRIAFDILLPIKNNWDKNNFNLKKVVLEKEKISENIKLLENRNNEIKLEKIEIEKLIPELEKNKVDLENLHKIVKIIDRKIEIEEKQQVLKTENNVLVKEKTEIEESILLLKNEKEEIENKCKNLSKIENNILLLNQKILDNSNKLKKFVELEKLFVNKKEKEKEVSDLREIYKIKLDENKKAKILEAEMEENFLKDRAGFLAEKLEENQACPVCGSLNHPNKAKPSATAPTEKQWKSQQKLCGDLEKELVEIEKEGITLKGDFNNVTKEINNILEELNIEKHIWLEQWEEYKKEKNAFEKEFESNKNEKVNLEKLEKTLESKEEKNKILAENSVENENKIQENTKEQNIIFGELNNINEQIKDFPNQENAKNQRGILEESIKNTEFKIKKNAEDLADISEKLSQGKGVYSQLENQEKTLEIEVKSGEEHLLSQLKNKNFSTVNEFEEILPSSREELEALENASKDYYLELEKLKSRLMESEYLKGKKCVEVSSLIEEKEKINSELSGIEIEIQNKITEVSKINSAIVESEKLFKLQQTQEKKYLPLIEISKTANGELTGKEKLGFEAYVQGFYFKNILIASNERFYEMTNKRYVLLKARSGENKKSQMGLEIEVLDNYTGEIRSVKSLSGGEAFKASLSLALGLSDVVQSSQGGIEIDIMLIDEGFGALDDESRIQAVSVLKKLSSNNRLVGVISHIDEIKDNIDKKILVEESRNGSKISLEV